jgi:hypothetical protein
MSDETVPLKEYFEALLIAQEQRHVQEMEAVEKRVTAEIRRRLYLWRWSSEPSKAE